MKIHLVNSQYTWEFGLAVSVMLFILVSMLQVIFAGVLLMLQILFVHGSWSTRWFWCFCTCFSCKTLWEVEPQIGLEYLKLRREKKNVIVNKEGPIALIGAPLMSFFLVCLFFLCFFFFLLGFTSFVGTIVTVVVGATIAIAMSLSSWLFGRWCQFIGKHKGDECP